MNQINYQELIKKICEENLIQDHQCKGVIPNTFIMCGEDDFQYCSDACLTIAKAKEYFTNLLNNPKKQS